MTVPLDVNTSSYPVSGSGLGLRRALMGPLQDHPPDAVDFFEVAPENWIGVGGRLGKQLRHFTERYPFVAHGLSLSIGSPAPLDETFLQRVKRLLDDLDPLREPRKIDARIAIPLCPNACALEFGRT